MSEKRTTKTATVSTSKIVYSQICLLCENTRVLPEGMYYCSTPWVCDECKEAIAFLKDFIKSYDKARDLLNEMENENERFYQRK